MSKSLIYLIGIFALWFYLYLADSKTDRKGFDLKEADKAESGHGGTTVAWRGGGFANPSYTEVTKGGSF